MSNSMKNPIDSSRCIAVEVPHGVAHSVVEVRVSESLKKLFGHGWRRIHGSTRGLSLQELCYEIYIPDVRSEKNMSSFFDKLSLFFELHKDLMPHFVPKENVR